MAVRILTASGLLVDAAVHLHLAPGYQESAPQGVGAGAVFILQAGAAVIAAGYVLLRGSRRSYLVALAVALPALVAVVAYRYVNIPALGPIPGMYEPVWFVEKALSAAAEALAVVTSIAAIWLLKSVSEPDGALSD